jgi:hypothetical protein
MQMVEKKKIEISELQILQEQNKILQQKLVDQERLNAELQKGSTFNLINEISKIREKGQSTANVIQVHESMDHKNISLWTRDGYRKGPMHPDNAIQTLTRFANRGVMLTVAQPTPEEIALYKATAEYKALEMAEGKRRAIKNNSRKGNQLEKMTQMIANLAGMKISDVNRILSPSEVGSKN